MHATERQATRRGARTDRCPRRLNRKRKKATGLDVSGIVEGAQRNSGRGNEIWRIGIFFRERQCARCDARAGAVEGFPGNEQGRSKAREVTSPARETFAGGTGVEAGAAHRIACIHRQNFVEAQERHRGLIGGTSRSMRNLTVTARSITPAPESPCRRN
jgi:hypothetical protein